ncbi:hypothetical protein EDB85DRAFT_1893088 [Lactarius pseudohatsudake]|nr:hypothetical protein EDB85DRAFT_1893088 [Lactarius pseudohatsudake]
MPLGRRVRTKKKREVRDEEAANLKRAAKGRVAEWLEKLAPPQPERGLVVSDAEVKQDTSSPSLPQDPAPATPPAPEPTITADPAPTPAQGTLAVAESKPNPRSSGFISVATLRRAPITLPATESAPPAQSNARRFANRYQAPPQVEMKYDVKSAWGGRVTAVASIWVEATKAGGGSAPTQVAKAIKANPAQPKAAAYKCDNNVVSTPKPAPAPRMPSIVAPGVRAATKDDDGRDLIGRGRPAAPAAPVLPAKAEKEDAPPAAARVPRALFGLGVAAATPSSPAFSSSNATPVLSSTASLAQPPGAWACARVPSPTPPPAMAAAAATRGTPSPQPPPPSQQSQQPAAAGWRAPLTLAVDCSPALMIPFFLIRTVRPIAAASLTRLV